MNSAVLGVLLAGGLARRMGGGDKPLRTIGGRTILDHVIERMQRQCAGLIVNANGDPMRFAPWGMPVVPDSVPGFAGPLAGILAGMEWAQEEPDITHIVSIPADTPFLPDDLVKRLETGARAAGVKLACAASGGRTHPVIGLWPIALADDLRHALTVQGERKIDRYTERHGVTAVEWPMDPVDPFFNANEPDDLKTAEKILAELLRPRDA
jgi:molybdopterin-guanine dinucleotide biosynthesis protein A